MYIDKLSETIILIDTEFLCKSIKFSYKVYEKAYPERKFPVINLGDLIYNIALNARVSEVGHNVDVIFAYTTGQPTLYNCEPDNAFFFNDFNQVSKESDIGNFFIRSFFANENKSSNEHYNELLLQIYNSSSVSRVIIVADNATLNPILNKMYEDQEKSLIMIRKYRNTPISR